MCVTAIIAGASLLLSAVGTVATIKGNNAQADWAKYQAKEQEKELIINTELNKISSLEKENERGREFYRQFSQSMSAIAASNVAEHISFFQGVAPDNLEQLNSEVRAIRLNMVHDVDRNYRQIGVIRHGAKVAGFNSKVQNLGAVAGFMKDAMAAASFYQTYSTPKTAPAGGG